MPIRVECGSCHASFKAPDGSAGKKGKCPKCSEAIVVPNGPTSPSTQSPPPIAPVFAAPDETKPCPSCAETIKAAAKKCRFCGEHVDGSRSADVRKKEIGTIEQTDKKWKKQQRIGGIIAVAGIVLGVICILGG